jgi:hypothetical protein
VVGLHDFLVGWFTATFDDTDASFARFADALDPDFTMIVPSGEVLGREAVVASVRAAHATAAGAFRIEIRDLVERASWEHAALLTYEEWQFLGGRVENRRVSTALLVRAPGAGGGVRWRHLHETSQEV